MTKPQHPLLKRLHLSGLTMIRIQSLLQSLQRGSWAYAKTAVEDNGHKMEGIRIEC